MVDVLLVLAPERWYALGAHCLQRQIRVSRLAEKNAMRPEDARSDTRTKGFMFNFEVALWNFVAEMSFLGGGVFGKCRQRVCTVSILFLSFSPD